MPNFRSVKQVIITATILFVIIDDATSQIDPHFSQYYSYPSFLNPALTGVFSGQYRATSLFRSQWFGVSSPFTTTGISADISTESNINVGIGLLNQVVKDVGYRFNSGSLNIAYTGVKFGEGQHNRVAFGIQPGIIARRVDVSRLTFGDQWNPLTGYNPSNPTQELIPKPNSFSFDLGAGFVYYNTNPLAIINPFLGFSVSHLNMPNNKISNSKENEIPMRYTAHGGMRIRLSDRFQLTPNALYMKQGTASLIMVGGYAELKTNEFYSIYFGTNYRYQDAISSYLGFGLKSLTVGLSYDVSVSKFSASSKGNSSFELSISYFKPKRIKSDEVEFVCPRL